MVAHCGAGCAEVAGAVDPDRDRILRLCDRPRTELADLVNTLREMEQPLRMVNPFAVHFHVLYRQVTERVLGFHRLGLCQHPEFIQVLALRFADRYFAAVRGWIGEDPDVPAAWMLLFEPDDESLDPAQYALLGVNAHINVDLALAVIDACAQLGIAPVSRSAQHHDYTMLNQVFHELIPSLRRVFIGFRPSASLVDCLENWLVHLIIDETRDQAWDEARRFWRKRNRPDYLADRVHKLDFAACLVAQVVATAPVRALLAAGPQPYPATLRAIPAVRSAPPGISTPPPRVT